jgi:hypothetical protein
MPAVGVSHRPYMTALYPNIIQTRISTGGLLCYLHVFPILRQALIDFLDIS